MDNLPRTMSFDDLITHELYHKYVDNGLEGKYFRWQVLLKNGWWYEGLPGDQETGRICSATAKLDPWTF